MTWWQILALAVFLTIIALWRMNLLLSLGSSAGWIAFLAYHMSNQPANVTAGSATDTYVIWGAVILIVVIPLISIARTRQRETSSSLGSVEGDAVRQNGNNKSPSLMKMDTAQYRAYIRNKLNRG
jgi:hypothetical protein